jgi:tetratricopeptide (TPR) repeat protein
VSAAALFVLGARVLAAAAAEPCAGAEAALAASTQALDQGRWADAERLFRPFAVSHADCPDALVVEGRLAARRGNLAGARQSFERAVRLAPDDAGARYHLGVWFFRGRLYRDAVEQLEKAAALRPADARAHDYLALAREGIGEADRAEEAYRAGLAVNQGAFFDPLLDYNYGRFLLKQHRLEESLSHLDRAVGLAPRRRGVHYERGKLHLARKDYAAARRDAEQALALPDPAGLVLDVQVYYLLATVYARLGETDLARKYAELARTTPHAEGNRTP